MERYGISEKLKFVSIMKIMQPVNLKFVSIIM